MASIAHVSPQGLQLDFTLDFVDGASTRVEGHYVSRHTLVTLYVPHVPDDEDEIETRQDRALASDREACQKERGNLCITIMSDEDGILTIHTSHPHHTYGLSSPYRTEQSPPHLKCLGGGGGLSKRCESERV